MTREEVFKAFIEILKGEIGIDKKALITATEETDIVNNLGVLSPEIVNIISKVEDRFDIEFDDDEVDALDYTIEATVSLIMKTLEAKGS